MQSIWDSKSWRNASHCYGKICWNQITHLAFASRENWLYSIIVIWNVVIYIFCFLPTSCSDFLLPSSFPFCYLSPTFPKIYLVRLSFSHCSSSRSCQLPNIFHFCQYHTIYRTIFDCTTRPYQSSINVQIPSHVQWHMTTARVMSNHCVAPVR